MTLSIELSQQKLERLKVAAEKVGEPIEKFVADRIDSILEREEMLKSTFAYVLKKNAELYRRLA